MIKINFGAGWDCNDDWINYDYSPTLFIERYFPFIRCFFKKQQSKFPINLIYGDIRNGLKYSNDTVDLIYSSHVIEHLCYEDATLAFRHVYRIMKPGAIFRFVLPDLEHIIGCYASSKAPSRADEFMRSTLLGVESKPKNFIQNIYNNFGNSRHLWMWDYNSIASELNNIGFKSVRRAYFNDSSNIEFLKVENFDRWENSLGLECIK